MTEKELDNFITSFMDKYGHLTEEDMRLATQDEIKQLNNQGDSNVHS